MCKFLEFLFSALGNIFCTNWCSAVAPNIYVTRCCFCLSLKSGGYVVAIASILFSTLQLALTAMSVTDLRQIIHNFTMEGHFTLEEAESLYTESFIEIYLAAGEVLLGIGLIYGLYKDKTTPLKVWLIYMVTLVLVTCMMLGYDLYLDEPGAIIFEYTGGLFMNTYCILVVYSYYIKVCHPTAAHRFENILAQSSDSLDAEHERQIRRQENATRRLSPEHGGSQSNVPAATSASQVPNLTLDETTFRFDSPVTT